MINQDRKRMIYYKRIIQRINLNSVIVLVKEFYLLSKYQELKQVTAHQHIYNHLI
jgi:hypothetical protein